MNTSELAERYLKKCEELGKSQNTVRQYRGRLRQFVEVCPELPTQTATIELYLKRRGETPAHRGAHFKVLQAFYAYLEEAEGIESPVPSKGSVGRPPRTGRIIQPAQQPAPQKTSPQDDKSVITEPAKKVYSPVGMADAIERYIQFKVAEGVSLRTQEQYRNRLNPFAKAFPIVPVNTDQIARFLAALDVDPETRWDYRKHIIAFYHFLEKREEIPVVSILFPKVRVPRKVRRVLSPEEMGRLFANAIGIQEKAMLTVLIDSKIRASELCSLTRENLFPDHIIVTGKTGQRTVPIRQETFDILSQLATEGPLFIVEGRPMNRHYLRVHIKKLMQRAGLEGEKLGPHILRHSSSVQHIMFGGDLMSLKEELGHTTTKMTEKYAALAFTQVKTRHEEVNVLGRIASANGLARAVCLDCGLEIRVKPEEAPDTVCLRCKQKGKWDLPDVQPEEMKEVRN